MGEFFGGIYDSLFGDEGIISQAANLFFGSSDEAGLIGGAASAEIPTGDVVGTTGLVESAMGSPDAPSLLDQIKKWATEGQEGIVKVKAAYDAANPATKNIIGQALQGLATAGINASAQGRMIQSRKDEEERANERYVERHRVTAARPGSFTQRPAPGGLIDSKIG